MHLQGDTLSPRGSTGRHQIRHLKPDGVTRPEGVQPSEAIAGSHNVDAVLRRMFLLYLFYQHVANDFCSLFVLSSNAMTISMALVVVPAIPIPRSMSDKANSEHDTT
jgi:hypothetical protein